MNPPDTDDPLDALWHEQNNHIEDNGFTARVISALPPARRCINLRTIFLLGATAVGNFLAILWLPWDNLSTSLTSLSLNSQTLLSFAVILAIVGSLVCGALAALDSEAF